MLASLCKSLSLFVGVQPASTWAGNDDVTAAEVVAWINEAQARIADEHDWQALLRDGYADLSSGAGVIEWAFDLPADYDRLVPQSVWLRALNRKVDGPLSAASWETERRRVQPSIAPVFTIAAGRLLVRAAQGGPGGGDLVVVDGALMLGAGVASGNLMTLRYVARVPDYTADTQVSALGVDLERAILLCAVALYRDAKGLPAGAAGGQYQSALSLAKARDMPIGTMSMSGNAASGGSGSAGSNTTFTLDVSALA